jgi:hypothetical protein
LFVQLVYFIAIWYSEWSFGILYGHLVHFCQFGMLFLEKSGIPDLSDEEDREVGAARRQHLDPAADARAERPDQHAKTQALQMEI